MYNWEILMGLWAIPRYVLKTLVISFVIAAALILFASTSEPKVLYKGEVFEQATKFHRCYSRYTNTTVWIPCEIFFRDKKLIRG